MTDAASLTSLRRRWWARDSLTWSGGGPPYHKKDAGNPLQPPAPPLNKNPRQNTTVRRGHATLGAGARHGLPPRTPAYSMNRPEQLPQPFPTGTRQGNIRRGRGAIIHKRQRRVIHKASERGNFLHRFPECRHRPLIDPPKPATGRRLKAEYSHTR